MYLGGCGKGSEGKWEILGCCLFFAVFGRGLEMGRGVDVFGDLEYLGSGYEKGGDVDVFGVWSA